MIDDKQVRRYIDALKAPAKAFEYCHPTTTAELVSLLEELLERRGAEQQGAAPGVCNWAGCSFYGQKRWHACDCLKASDNQS